MLRYRKLVAWERARALTLAVYAASKAFPTSERFGIGGQMRRAGVSVVTNIAEGSAKTGKPEFGRYLDMALGSLAELDALIDLCEGLGLLMPADARLLYRLRVQTSKVTWALRMKMRT